MVRGAIPLAVRMKVSMLVIGLTIVSYATSVPELTAWIIAAFKKKKDLSIGNLIGSNIFNIFAVLGVTSMIHPIQVIDEGLIHNDVWWMFGLALFLYPWMFFFYKSHIGRLEGFLVLLILFFYIFFFFNVENYFFFLDNF